MGHDDKDDQRGVALRNVEHARENAAVADLAPLREVYDELIAPRVQDRCHGPARSVGVRRYPRRMSAATTITAPIPAVSSVEENSA